MIESAFIDTHSCSRSFLLLIFSGLSHVALLWDNATGYIAMPSITYTSIDDPKQHLRSISHSKERHHSIYRCVILRAQFTIHQRSIESYFQRSEVRPDIISAIRIRNSMQD